jgi:hypothetical protein
MWCDVKRAVIVFNDLDISNGVVDYTIRMNYTVIPRTTSTQARRTLGLDAQYQRYFWSGFSTLQRTIDDAVLELTARDRNVTSLPASGNTHPIHL